MFFLKISFLFTCKNYNYHPSNCTECYKNLLFLGDFFSNLKVDTKLLQEKVTRKGYLDLVYYYTNVNNVQRYCVSNTHTIYIQDFQLLGEHRNLLSFLWFFLNNIYKLLPFLSSTDYFITNIFFYSSEIQSFLYTRKL